MGIDGNLHKKQQGETPKTDSGKVKLKPLNYQEGIPVFYLDISFPTV